MFVGNDVAEAELVAFKDIPALTIVRSPVFSSRRARQRLADASLFGIDHNAARTFQEHAVNVVFESATFYGWRFPFPTVAWLPDFQHRYFPEFFGMASYVRRELGYRAQIHFRRSIMLSSEDARADCEKFYPSSIGRTVVVRFGVHIDPADLNVDPTQVAREYELPERFFYLPNQFWKHKNHRLVVDALSMLKRKGHDIVVAVSGNPNDPRHPEFFQTLKQLVVDRDVVGNFRVLGMIPRHHVLALMRACTALINPSLCEGWSTTVEEAKALGAPILLSDLRVHREQASELAQFFEPTSAEQLAGLLLERQKSLPSTYQESRTRSIELTSGRMRKYADDFVEAVDKAVVNYR